VLQESKNPLTATIPSAILVSLANLHALVSVVSAGWTGRGPLRRAPPPGTVSYAMERIGAPCWFLSSNRRRAVLVIGSVILVSCWAVPVFYSMSRDGLLGRWASKVHRVFRTPYLSRSTTRHRGVRLPPGSCRCRWLGDVGNNRHACCLIVLVLLRRVILRQHASELDAEAVPDPAFVPLVPLPLASSSLPGLMLP